MKEYYCATCKAPILQSMEYYHWLALVLYFENKYDEGKITLEVYEKMEDHLMSIRPKDFEEKAEEKF